MRSALYDSPGPARFRRAAAVGASRGSGADDARTVQTTIWLFGFALKDQCRNCSRVRQNAGLRPRVLANAATKRDKRPITTGVFPHPIGIPPGRPLTSRCAGGTTNPSVHGYRGDETAY